MTSLEVPPKTFVRIMFTLLEPDQRAPGLVSDTAATPYVVRCNGYLLEKALIGDLVVIRTVAGRQITGKLTEVQPVTGHGFGQPDPALAAAISEITLLKEELVHGE